MLLDTENIKNVLKEFSSKLKEPGFVVWLQEQEYSEDISNFTEGISVMLIEYNTLNNGEDDGNQDNE
jgi:hypothetical protein